MILKRIRGSMTKNQQQVIAELASQPVDAIAGEDMVDSTRVLRSYVLNYLYGDGTGAIALVNDSSPTAIDETAGGIAVTIDGGTWGRFNKGDQVVFTDSSYTLKTGNGSGGATGYARVVSVDGDARTIKIQAEPGVGTITIADNDYILLGETYDFNASSVLVPNGFESLLINSGVFPGSISPWAVNGLDVGDYTELKAFVAGTDGASEDPTMDAVTELLDKIEEHGYAPPRAWISERGVWTLHAQIERANHGVVQIPMGATFQAAGGVAGPVLSHMEQRFSKFSSKRVRPNCIIAINPDTWMKFMPLGDRTIRWAVGNGALAGYPTIYRPVTSGTRLTELAEAPFDSYCEFGCKNPRANFRRLGLRAQRDV
jgi:hypothetical protein